MRKSLWAFVVLAMLLPASTTLGNGVADCDFNGDGIGDLAVGAPFEDLSSTANAGMVTEFRGTVGGPVVDRNWHQNSEGVQGAPDVDDWFGYAVECGNFDGDAYQDAAIGVAYDGANLYGSVAILFGGVGGLTNRDQRIYPDLPNFPAFNQEAFFGASMAAGDFDGDGFDDLAIGQLLADVGGVVDAGSVTVMYGGVGGLAIPGSENIYQAKSGVLGAAETNEVFGYYIAAGDTNGDGFDDLAVGSAAEDGAGQVNVLFGSAGGITFVGDQLWSQDSTGVFGSAESGDTFGGLIAIGDFTGDGYGDLAISAQGEDDGFSENEGMVHTLPGSAAGPTSTESVVMTLDSLNVFSSDPSFFGAAMDAADVDGDGFADLAIGAPGFGVDDVPFGAVLVRYGTMSGFESGAQLFTQETPGVFGTGQFHDAFGRVIRFVDLNGDTFLDLTIGVPNDHVGSVPGAGAVNVLFGTSSGITTADDIRLDQGGSNVETGDAFSIVAPL